jgi:hypothetical protein
VSFPIHRARRLPALAAALLVLAVAACSGDRAGAPSRAAAAAHGAGAQKPGGADSNLAGLIPLPEDAAAKELRTYELTMDRFNKWAKGQAALNAASAKHPEIGAAMAKASPPKTLDEMIQVISAQPVLNTALRESGTNVHDYLLTMFAMNAAMQAYQRKAAGALPPSGLPPTLLTNIAFVEKNLTAIKKALSGIPR